MNHRDTGQTVINTTISYAKLNDTNITFYAIDKYNSSLEEHLP